MSIDSTPRALVAVRAACALFLSLLFLPPTVRAQDAVRPSLAGEAAASARRQSIEQIPYNLLAGPVRFLFSVTTGVEYNDNINLSQVNKQSDVIIRPQFNLNAIWPVTQLNTLKFSLGLGYDFYLEHSNSSNSGIILAPGSELSFDIFVGDFRINVHDRFSLLRDPVTDLQVSNVVDYGRFENTGGVSVLWDLNKAVLTFGYDHYTYVSTSNTYSYLDRNAEELNFSAYFALSSTTGAGLETAAVYSYYSQNFLNNAVAFSIGPFVETQVSNYLKLRAAAGYQLIDFSSGDGVSDSDNASNFYANVLLSHRVNAALTQSISAGHETLLGQDSNYVVLNYVRYNATWNIIRGLLLSTEGFYETGDDDAGSPFAEDIQRYGGAATLAYQLTPHVTLGLRYQYIQKQSDLPLRDYQQNSVVLDGTYSF